MLVVLTIDRISFSVFFRIKEGTTQCIASHRIQFEDVGRGVVGRGSRAAEATAEAHFLSLSRFLAWTPPLSLSLSISLCVLSRLRLQPLAPPGSDGGQRADERASGNG